MTRFFNVSRNNNIFCLSPWIIFEMGILVFLEMTRAISSSVTISLSIFSLPTMTVSWSLIRFSSSGMVTYCNLEAC